MDPETELASGFTVRRFQELRPRLDPDNPELQEWVEVVSAFKRRIYERFLKPIRQLALFDRNDPLPFRPGFAILALDCLLIDTIQSFREGRGRINEISPARSFKEFLRSPRFADFSSRDRSDFFDHVRNGLLHNGETRRNWKSRIDTSTLLTRDLETGTRTINRRLFHARVIREFRDLSASITRTGAQYTETRRLFLKRMDALGDVEDVG